MRAELRKNLDNHQCFQGHILETIADSDGRFEFSGPQKPLKMMHLKFGMKSLSSSVIKMNSEKPYSIPRIICV